MVHTRPSLPNNPKDRIGARKWRQYAAIPCIVIWELGVAMLEGALKYGYFNWRKAGVVASIYTDAAKGHIDAWTEGEDLDPDTKLNHITKAIATLVVLRDSMLHGNLVDDRPPKNKSTEAVKTHLKACVEKLYDMHCNPDAPWIIEGLPSWDNEGYFKELYESKFRPMENLTIDKKEETHEPCENPDAPWNNKPGGVNYHEN